MPALLSPGHGPGPPHARRRAPRVRRGDGQLDQPRRRREWAARRVPRDPRRRRGAGIKTSITSNGLSVQALDDERLKRFHSVELSLDFPTEREHDAFRGRETGTPSAPRSSGALGLRRAGNRHRGDDEHQLRAAARSRPRGRQLRREPPGQRLSAVEDRPLHAGLRAAVGRLPRPRCGHAPRGHDRAGAGRRARAAGLSGPGCGRSTVRIAPTVASCPARTGPRAG